MIKKWVLLASGLLFSFGVNIPTLASKKISKKENDLLLVFFKDDVKKVIQIGVGDGLKGSCRLLRKGDDDVAISAAKKVLKSENCYTTDCASPSYRWPIIASFNDTEGWLKLRQLLEFDDKTYKRMPDELKKALKDADMWEIFGFKKKPADDEDSFFETYAPAVIFGLIGLGLLGGTYWLCQKYFKRSI